MRHNLLLLLPALQEVLSARFRTLKYSLFPPLGLLTLAAQTPEERFRILVRDDHVESPWVEDCDVDLVAMTVYISSAHRAYELADAYRRRGAKVVLGGIHPTALPREAARHADAVCVGPAEFVWPQILRDFEHGELRRFYRGRCDGSAAEVPAVARRDLMNPRAYLVPATMVTGRGCPNACRFCYKSGFWGSRYYERRPLADIEAELATLPGRFVFFLDDNFLADRRRAREIFAVLRGAGKIWQAAGSLAAAREPRFLEEAYAAGCRSLFVGFESLSPTNMRQMGKGVNAAADYAAAIRRFHDAGIMINGSFVFGFDGDGPDAFGRTVEFAVANGIETATFHILTPYPGTPAFAEFGAQGRLLHRDWRRYDTRHAVFRPRRMSPERLEAGYWRAYRDFYSTGSIVRRSRGLAGAARRFAYSFAWKRLDRLWSAIIHAGLLPAVRPLFERVLAGGARQRASASASTASRGARQWRPAGMHSPSHPAVPLSSHRTDSRARTWG
jgi:radical SAM superfamily enzyme YgiQ (UPF0313 family)